MKRKKEKPNGRVGRILKNERRRKQGMRWQLQDGGVEDGAENDKKQTAHMWGAKEKKKEGNREKGNGIPTRSAHSLEWEIKTITHRFIFCGEYPP